MENDLSLMSSVVLPVRPSNSMLDTAKQHSNQKIVYSLSFGSFKTIWIKYHDLPLTFMERSSSLSHLAGG